MTNISPYYLALLVVFTPLLGAISGLVSRTIKPRTAEIFTTTLAFIALAASLGVFYLVVIGGNSYNYKLVKWIDIANFKAWWSLKIDPLTAIMYVVVTSVSSLVHLYSIGYMHRDPHRARFMAYLSLFTFAMLMLVSSDNFLQLFFGWEGVGLCSYLLIGFWFKKDTATAAAMKAFIVNRVGDIGLALGIFSIYKLFGSLEFESIFANVKSYQQLQWAIAGAKLNPLELIAALLFVGAMGKSAQFMLHTWLPDAMEGPTPVSALIHAATMVTAGVFLVVRCSYIFECAPTVLNIVTIVGGVTAIFAASVALTQNDIKRVVAYSTCSQLGYMFMACGVSAYPVAIFHLATHAFFKALLFLGCGSVIHALHDEQNINHMGGLWRKLPYSYVLMLIGSLALAGIFPLAGYYSKDAILEALYVGNNPVAKYAFSVGIVTALLTSFYSWRLFIKVFHGPSNTKQEIYEAAHEASDSMMIPMILLAIGAIFSGWYGAMKLGIIDASLAMWQTSVPFSYSIVNVLTAMHYVSDAVKFAPLIASIVGIMFACLVYSVHPSLARLLAKWFKPLYRFLYHKWYIDELYNFILIRPVKKLSHFSAVLVDRIIDRYLPGGASSISIRGGFVVSKIQNGLLYNYAFIMVLGLAAVITWIIYNFIGY